MIGIEAYLFNYAKNNLDYEPGYIIYMILIMVQVFI